MIAARVLNAAHGGLDRAATAVLLVADWCSRTAWALDPDERFDDEDRSGWPLDPDGYHVDGQHKEDMK